MIKTLLSASMFVCATFLTVTIPALDTQDDGSLLSAATLAVGSPAIAGEYEPTVRGSARAASQDARHGRGRGYTGATTGGGGYVGSPSQFGSVKTRGVCCGTYYNNPSSFARGFGQQMKSNPAGNRYNPRAYNYRGGEWSDRGW